MSTIAMSEDTSLLMDHRGHTLSSTSTPRSPFETGFPTLFASPLPTPRPHRLALTKPQRRHRELHVFLTFTMSTVGAGMLSVPYTFLLVPTWAAVLGIVIVGVGMALTANALLLSHVQLAKQEEEQGIIGSGRSFASFQAIAVAAGGDALGYAVSIVTAVGVYGGCVGCVRIVRDIAPFLVVMLHRFVVDTQPLLLTTAQQIGDYVMWMVFVVVVFPLCLMKNLTKLHISSYLGFFFSLYLLVAIIYRSYNALEPRDRDGGNVPVNTTVSVAGTVTAAVNIVAVASEETAALAAAAKLPTVITGSTLSKFAYAISIYNYAFMMHLNLVPLFIQLRGSFSDPLKETSWKMSRCIFGLSAFCVVFYSIFGFFAEKLYSVTVRGNVLLNLENDPLMNVPLVAVFSTVVLSYPLLFHPLRSVLEELFYSTNLDNIPFVDRLGVSTILLFSQILLAIVVPGIEVIFGLTGAVTCFMMCFFFPVIFFSRLYPWDQVRGGKLWITALWVMVAFVMITARDKLGQILDRVLEKMAVNESQVFTSSEKDQLKKMLGIEDAQIQEVVDIAKEIFGNAATFGEVDRTLLRSRGVHDKLVQAVEKMWRKKGRAMAKQIELYQTVETPALVLQKTDWRLHLQMGSSKRSGQSEPTAIFQLNVADKSSATKEIEKLDIELSHAELRSLFLQLNTIQAELDASETPSVTVRACSSEYLE
ncbi:unnamed protein product [Peronospora farinosa]|uniref:COMM domain-containing protein n=2 Tax=Peronospora farinosa TaxID=134698 RepID=A0AAV0UTR5_9STRA|nr:unnamed protein product [Peronospora farinosa]CAI5740332.1 unnamed protein product [Peronospora farinosa]